MTHDVTPAEFAELQTDLARAIHLALDGSATARLEVDQLRDAIDTARVVPEGLRPPKPFTGQTPIRSGDWVEVTMRVQWDDHSATPDRVGFVMMTDARGEPVSVGIPVGPHTTVAKVPGP